MLQLVRVTKFLELWIGCCAFYPAFLLVSLASHLYIKLGKFSTVN